MIMVMAYFLLLGSVSNQYLYAVIFINISVTLFTLGYDQIVVAAAIKSNRALHDAPYIIRWHLRYILSLVIIGSIWGSWAILFIEPIQGDFLNLTKQANPTALYVCAMVTVSGLAIALGVVPTIFLSFALCIMLPYTIILLVHPATNYNWMGYGSTICLVTACFLAWQTYQRSMHTLSLQYENTALLKDLREEGLALIKANKDKSRFLAAASHDLRQPLHTSNLLLGVLEGELNTDKQRDRLEHLKQAIDAQTQLLNSLLNVSQLDAGLIKAAPSHTPLNEIISGLGHEFNTEATKQNRRFIIKNAKVTAFTDKILLQRVLRNLLTNAFRHTQYCTIKLGIQAHEKHISIYVKDSGQGISEDEADNIYSEFYQLNNPERDRNKGLGLGLSIVKRLCDLLNHPISMQSTINIGTCFTIEVPYGQPTKVELETPDTRPSLIIPFTGQHILVIDDEKSVIDAMEMAAQQWSCHFSSATSAEEALKVVKAGAKPDILISDYRLPNKQTGLDCIQAIRLIAGKDIPALIISGDTDPKILKLINDSELIFLHKPVKLAQLRIAITQLLQATPSLNRSQL